MGRTVGITGRLRGLGEMGDTVQLVSKCKQREGYAQNVVVSQDGSKVVLEIFECDELLTSCIYSVTGERH